MTMLAKIFDPKMELAFLRPPLSFTPSTPLIARKTAVSFTHGERPTCAEDHVDGYQSKADHSKGVTPFGTEELDEPSRKVTHP